MPIVSIIIPVYNCEMYLGGAVDSVLRQTVEDWELIIVNDGSTDSSGVIAHDYASRDCRIKVVDKPNGGLSYARNRGLDVCTGEWIVFVDADDELYPRALACLLKGQQDTGADIVVSRMTDGQSVSPYPSTDCKVSVLNPVKAIEMTLYQRGNLIPSAWAKLYNRRIFECERYTEGMYYEDIDSFYRFYLQCDKIAAIKAETYFYRTNPESFLHKWGAKRLDVLTVTQRAEEYMAQYRPELVRAARDRRLSANFNMCILAAMAGENEVADGCWQTIKELRPGAITNPRVRMKNKAGVLLSYLVNIRKTVSFIQCIKNRLK